MATRTEPIPVFSLIGLLGCDTSWTSHDTSLCVGYDAAFGGDELVEPANLAVHRLEPVLLQLEGVAVELFSRATQGARDLFPAFFEPAAPALEDVEPDVGVGLREEG